MKQRVLVKVIQVLFALALIATLAQPIAPAGTVLAQEPTSTSDLVVNLVSAPRRSHACEVFQAIYTVKNLGPDPAYNISVMVHIPDAYHDIALLGVPYSLAVGETATFSAVIWVGSFVPGEIRRAWVGVTVSMPEANFDPDLENNSTRKDMRIASKRVENCLPRYSE